MRAEPAKTEQGYSIIRATLARTSSDSPHNLELPVTDRPVVANGNRPNRISVQSHNHHYILCAKSEANLSNTYSFCRLSHEFRKHVLFWLRNNDINVEGSWLDFWQVRHMTPWIHHILSLGKYYIYSEKCQNNKPSLKFSLPKRRDYTLS